MATVQKMSPNACDGVSVKRYTVKDLFYCESLESLVSKGAKFQMMAYHLDNFAAFDLVPEDSEDSLFWLREDIFEAVNDMDTAFGWKPKKLDIVLGMKGTLVGYHRCIITDFAKDKNYASVFWIDVGGTGDVPIADLKPVNKEVMKHPRLAYSVELDNTAPSSNFILHMEFKKAMEKIIREKTRLTVEFCGSLKRGIKIFCKTKVRLTFMNSERKRVDLRDLITKLKVWEWETFSNLTGDDDEILKGGKWGREFHANFQGRSPFSYLLPPENYQFSATVARVLMDGQNEKNAVVNVFLLSSPLYFNFFNVLHHQMERYAANVRKSKFFPALQEPLMFKLVNKPEYNGLVKSLGTWHRAIRIDKKIIYLFDLDEYIFFEYLPEDDYEWRPLYSEFLKIPCMILTLRPTQMGIPVPWAEARFIFKSGTRFDFTVTKHGDVNAEEPYEVSFELVGDQQKQNITIKNFLGANSPERN